MGAEKIIEDKNGIGWVGVIGERQFVRGRENWDMLTCELT